MTALCSLYCSVGFSTCMSDVMDVRALQVPADSITAKSEPVALNQGLLKGVSQTFSGTPEMRLTDTGIDDTLLSFVRCAVASEAQILAAGWSPNWAHGQPGGNDDLPLDVMAKLVTPVDFNTEARVCFIP
jgi:hypothetical protein